MKRKSLIFIFIFIFLFNINIVLSRSPDINEDNEVNLLDILIVVNDFGKTSGFDERVDLNGDGVINIFDILELVKNWGNKLSSCSFLEKINVPSDGTFVNSKILKNGVNYLLNSSGTYQYWYPSNPSAIADAEYAETSSSGNRGWTNPSDGNFELQINGQDINWGDYNTDHNYIHEFTGQGTPISLRVIDDYYPDNQGNLIVKIEECESNQNTNGNQCSCSWTNIDCGGSRNVISCSESEMLQHYACVPDSCEQELYRCISSAVCSKTSGPNFNPPYPRIGQVTFYDPSLAGPDIWRNHDLVVIRFYIKDTPKLIKQNNPDVILLATNDDLLDNSNNPFPDVWHLKAADGSNHRSNPLQDITNFCPKANGGFGSQRFNEFFPEFLVDRTDWNYFDGTFFDYWSNAVWSNPQLVDIDRDGNANSKSEVNNAWKEGNKKLIENFRKLSNKPIVAHESGQSYLNGKGFEFWSNNAKNPDRLRNQFKSCLDLQKNSVKPIINLAEGNSFGELFRAEFTAAVICGAYYGHDEGSSAHRWTFMHDEYEAYLGYPLPGADGEAKEIESNLWVRYFDEGVVISNLGGGKKKVCTNQLTGGPYYRFKGNQDPSFYNGTRFTCVNFENYDGIMLLKQPATLVTPIIIDNVKFNMNSIGQDPVKYSSGWKQVKPRDGKNAEAYYLAVNWGENSEPFASSSTKGSTATYQPKFGVEGKYEVFEWHPDVQKTNLGKSCSDVNVIINHENGKVSKTIDQSKNSGQWNSLGIFNFNKGNSGNVVLTAPGDCVAASDAIKFVSIFNTKEVNAESATPPNFKVAFIGDSGAGADFESVLNLIKNEEADLVLHQGDFAYSKDPDNWKDDINRILGSDFPYLGSRGNHDDWDQYKDFFINRLTQMKNAGDLASADNPNDAGDTTYTATYKGLKMVFNYGQENSGSYIDEVLSNDNSIWKICSQHQSGPGLSLEKTGGYRSNSDACAKNGAIIMSAHSHQYGRTKTLMDLNPPTKDSDSLWNKIDKSRVNPETEVEPGRTVAFVTGTGGQSKRSSDSKCGTITANGCNDADLWASWKGNTYGATFIEFNVDGNPKKARGYFKNINNEIIDSFIIISETNTSP